MLSSMASQSRHRHLQLTLQLTVRSPRREAKSEAMRIEEESSKVRRIMELETWAAEEPGAEEEELVRKRQLLEVGEVLAAAALEDLIPARPLYGTKSGTELDPQVVGAGRRKQLGSLEQKAIILVPRDFPLTLAKRVRSKRLDDYTAGEAEVKPRLVATMACGNRDDCFASCCCQADPGRAAQQCCTKLSTALARLPGCGSASCATRQPMRTGKHW